MSEVTTGSIDRRGFLRKGLIAGVGVAAVAYGFRPFTPKLPSPLGAFHSFAG